MNRLYRQPNFRLHVITINVHVNLFKLHGNFCRTTKLKTQVTFSRNEISQKVMMKTCKKFLNVA